MEESKEDKEWRELFNEGIQAMQIIEWFEKRRPEPQIPDGEPHRPDSLAWAMWEQWHRELVHYADGWKDALQALKERQELEYLLDHEPQTLRWLLEYLPAFPEEYLGCQFLGTGEWWELTPLILGEVPHEWAREERNFIEEKE